MLDGVESFQSTEGIQFKGGQTKGTKLKVTGKLGSRNPIGIGRMNNFMLDRQGVYTGRSSDEDRSPARIGRSSQINEESQCLRALLEQTLLAIPRGD